MTACFLWSRRQVKKAWGDITFAPCLSKKRVNVCVCAAQEKSTTVIMMEGEALMAGAGALTRVRFASGVSLSAGLARVAIFVHSSAQIQRLITHTSIQHDLTSEELQQLIGPTLRARAERQRCFSEDIWGHVQRSWPPMQPARPASAHLGRCFGILPEWPGRCSFSWL